MQCAAGKQDRGDGDTAWGMGCIFAFAVCGHMTVHRLMVVEDSQWLFLNSTRMVDRGLSSVQVQVAVAKEEGRQEEGQEVKIATGFCRTALDHTPLGKHGMQWNLTQSPTKRVQNSSHTSHLLCGKPINTHSARSPPTAICITSCASAACSGSPSSHGTKLFPSRAAERPRSDGTLQETRGGLHFRKPRDWTDTSAL